MEPLNPSKTEFKMEGLFADVWFNLQYVMNFTYYLTKPPDGEWGAIQLDGTWSGMVNELQQQRADMGNIKIILINYTMATQKLDYLEFYFSCN